MKTLLSFIVIAIVFVACSDPNAPKEDLKKEISDQEARVTELSKDYKNAEKADSAKAELADVLVEYYHEFPEDEYAATCLSKLHMLYSGMEEKETAAAYVDTLLEKFPDFVDRSQMIESQIMIYEMDVKPRNPEMVKKYLKLWLKENKDAPKEKIKEMQEHLETVGLSWEERILKQSEQ